MRHKLDPKARVHILQASSLEERDKWVSALRLAALLEDELAVRSFVLFLFLFFLICWLVWCVVLIGVGGVGGVFVLSVAWFDWGAY